MDPIAAVRLINCPNTCDMDREFTLCDLAEWVAKGGFVSGIVPINVNLLDGQHLIDIAAAVNVATQYGDMTGLKGLGFVVV